MKGMYKGGGKSLKHTHRAATKPRKVKDKGTYHGGKGKM